MFRHFSHTRLLRYAGLFTWAMVGVPLVYSQYVPAHGGDGYDAGFDGRRWTWLFFCYFGFGVCYWWLTRGLGNAHARWYEHLLLLVLTLLALSVSYFNGSGLGSILLMVAAGAIPWLLRPAAGVPLLLASQLAVLPIYHLILYMPLFEATMQALLYGGFSLFIYVTSMVAKQQAQASDTQQRLNAELRATRILLAESARINERTRISRELHDLLGHHLTALSLNLEVASHIAAGPALEHVKQSQTLAKLLLSDVRQAVSRLRENGTINLAAALYPLVGQVPTLEIDMNVEPSLTLDDPERAHVLLRCTQEIITNTARHAKARHLWIQVWREEDRIILEAYDDGLGTDDFMSGNGLRGMRERVQQLAGEMSVQTRRGAGFRLRLVIPVAVSGTATTQAILHDPSLSG